MNLETQKTVTPTPAHEADLPLVVRQTSLTVRALWLTCAKALSFAFAFALPLLVVRRLDQTAFGIYKASFQILSTSLIILPLGFMMSAYYFLPRESLERRAQVVLNIVLVHVFVGVLAFVVLFARPDLLARLFGGEAEIQRLSPLIGAVIMLWLSAVFLETIAVANNETKQASIFIITAQLTKTVFMLVAALLFANVESLLYAALLHSFGQICVLFWYLRSRFPGFWRSFDFAMLREQLVYAVPLGLIGLLYVMQTDLHNYVVLNRFGATEFAIYANGCFNLPLVMIISEAVGSVMIPQISILQKSDERREILLLLGRTMRKIAVIFLPLYVFLTVMAREFVVVMFTERYLASVPVFLINLLLLPVSIISLDPVVRAYREQARALLVVRAVLILFLIAALWFVTIRYGLIGAISVVVLTRIVEQLAMMTSVGRLLGVRRGDAWMLRDVGKILAAALIAGAFAFVLRHWLMGITPLVVLTICALVFGAIYAGALLVAGVVTPEEKTEVRGAIARGIARFNLLWRTTQPVA